MHRLIILAFAAILLSASALAAIIPSTSYCDENGTTYFQIKQEGKKDLYDYSFFALKRAAGTSFNMTGKWMLGNLSVSEIDSEDALFPRFIPDQRFTGKGVYVVTISDAKESAVFLVGCPGIGCRLHSECEGSDFCNLDNICETLLCRPCEVATNHECRSMCNDGNACTEDSCVNGTCENIFIRGCCLTDRNCNDGLMCTNDICRNYRCTHSPLECKTRTRCEMAECREFAGCVVEMNETCAKEGRKFREFLASSVFGKILKLTGLLD